MENVCFLIGNLAATPELQHAGETQYVKFRIATNESWKNKDGEKQERVDWHSITLWGKWAEEVATWPKGTPVYVTGQLRSGSYDKDGVTIYTYEVQARTVRRFGKLPKKDDTPPAGQPPRSNGQPPKRDEPPVSSYDNEPLPFQDDDIPF